MPPITSYHVRFYFYQIVRGLNSIGSFPGILQEIQRMPFAQQEIEIKGIPLILAGETCVEGHCTAFLMTRKRMSAIPQKIRDDGSRESLNLLDNEGLGEDTAIAIDPTGTIAAIQHGKYAMSANTIASYINKALPDAMVGFRVIATIDTLSRIQNARQLRKLHIKLGGVLDFSLLQNYGMSASDAVSLQQVLHAPSLDLTWSACREQDGLLHKFMEWIPIFKRYSEQPEALGLKALEATIKEGVDDESLESVTINLLADKPCHDADVVMNASREIDRQGLLQAACNALSGHRHELEPYVAPARDH